jgi:hypothetical protein
LGLEFLLRLIIFFLVVLFITNCLIIVFINFHEYLLLEFLYPHSYDNLIYAPSDYI